MRSKKRTKVNISGFLSIFRSGRKTVLSLLMVSLWACKNDDDGPTTLTTGTIQPGIVSSAILSQSIKYNAYLPNGYSDSQEDYPVLYLLHGFSGDHDEWRDNGLAATADDLINDEVVQPMIIVMPDGIESFYCNNFQSNGVLYEDFFVQEFIPTIESEFRIQTSSGKRAIAGVSMGGYGATFHAFKYPEMYSSAFSISGALYMGSFAPDLRETVNALTESQLQALPFFAMECGTEDETELRDAFTVISANNDFDSFLTEKGINHNYVSNPGQHDWTFFKAALPNVLQTANDNF